MIHPIPVRRPPGHASGAVANGAQQGNSRRPVLAVGAVYAVVDDDQRFLPARNGLPVLGDAFLQVIGQLLSAEYGLPYVFRLLKGRGHPEFQPLLPLREEYPKLQLQHARELIDQIAHDHSGPMVLHIGFYDRVYLPLLRHQDRGQRGGAHTCEVSRLSPGHGREASHGTFRLKHTVASPGADRIVIDLHGHGAFLYIFGPLHHIAVQQAGMGIDSHLASGCLDPDAAASVRLQLRRRALLYDLEPHVKAGHAAGRKFTGKYHPLVPVHAEVAGLLCGLAGNLLPVAVHHGIGELLVPQLSGQHEFHVHRLLIHKRMRIVHKNRNRIAVL